MVCSKNQKGIGVLEMAVDPKNIYRMMCQGCIQDLDTDDLKSVCC